jgi:DNA-binding MarR family transcriptional regulator
MFIPDEFFRTNEFLDFSKTREFQLYYFLRAYIVRESKIFGMPYYHPAYGVYNNYYKKGMLVGRYSQSMLATILETTENKVRERIKSLEQKGFVKKIKIQYKNYKICFYQLGDWEGKLNDKGSYKENFYLDSYFELMSKKETEQRYKNRDTTPPR